jgi:hypothetical protein
MVYDIWIHTHIYIWYVGYLLKYTAYMKIALLIRYEMGYIRLIFVADY